MRLRSNRGQILLNVLCTAAVVLVIAAALLRLVLMRATIAQRLSSGGQSKIATQAAYQQLLADWGQNGTCHSPGGGVTCSGAAAGSCGCTCSGSFGGITINVATSGSATSCSIQASTVGQ